MGKKYFDTKKDTLESSILGVWAEAAKKQEGLDAVNPKALKKKFDDRKDKDIDNDGDTDDSDEYLHNRRKAVSKSIANEEVEIDEAKGSTKYVVMQGPGDNNQKVIATFDGGSKALEKAKKFRDDWNKKNKSKIKLNKEGKPIAAHMARIFDKGVETSYKVGDKVSYSEFAPSIIKDEVDLDEGFGVSKDIPAMEVGTNRYRDYALDVTPGQTDPEWAQARDFKVASMKEALAKVWGLDEKTLDKTSKEDYDEEDEELKPVKGSKTMTGGKVAKVDTKPKT